MEIKFPSGEVTNLDFNAHHGPNGQFSSGSGPGAPGGGSISVKPVPAPSKAKQTIQHAAGVLAEQGITLIPMGSKPNEKGQWITSYRLVDKNGKSQDVEVSALKKMMYK
jgi:hypothetical protein